MLTTPALVYFFQTARIIHNYTQPGYKGWGFDNKLKQIGAQMQHRQAFSYHPKTPL
jgi:hypothetical protein